MSSCQKIRYLISVLLLKWLCVKLRTSSIFVARHNVLLNNKEYVYILRWIVFCIKQITISVFFFNNRYYTKRINVTVPSKIANDSCTKRSFKRFTRLTFRVIAVICCIYVRYIRCAQQWTHSKQLLLLGGDEERCMYIYIYILNKSNYVIHSVLISVKDTE